MPLKPIASIHTPYHADAIRIINEEIAVVGCYECVENSDTRTGCLVVIETTEDFCNTSANINFPNNPGVLDLEHHSQYKNILYCGLSSGDIGILNVPTREIHVIDNKNESNLKNVIISIDVNEFLNSKYSFASLSTGGEIRVYNDVYEVISTFKSPDLFENWSIEFLDENIVSTGGDDCQCHLYDLRMDRQYMGSTSAREAGVTDILSIGNDYFYAGGYDDLIYLWDIRNLSEPVKISPKLSGGVWSMFKTQLNTLLISGCYGGMFSIDDGLSVVEEYGSGPHESMVYGACFTDEKFGGRAQVISVSFNDNCVGFWE